MISSRFFFPLARCRIRARIVIPVRFGVPRLPGSSKIVGIGNTPCQVVWTDRMEVQDIVSTVEKVNTSWDWISVVLVDGVVVVVLFLFWSLMILVVFSIDGRIERGGIVGQSVKKQSIAGLVEIEAVESGGASDLSVVVWILEWKSGDDVWSEKRLVEVK